MKNKYANQINWKKIFYFFCFFVIYIIIYFNVILIALILLLLGKSNIFITFQSSFYSVIILILTKFRRHPWNYQVQDENKSFKWARFESRQQFRVGQRVQSTEKFLYFWHSITPLVVSFFFKHFFKTNIFVWRCYWIINQWYSSSKKHKNYMCCF